MDEPSFWQWVWVGTAVFFALGEMANPGSFFLLPFAIGAVVAAIVTILTDSVAAGWASFLGVSVVALLALRPLARRLDQDGPVEGIGAKRLIGEQGSVIQPIGGEGDLGLVRINREEWRAASVEGAVLEAGSRVKVVEVRGTSVVVHPVQSLETES